MTKMNLFFDYFVFVIELEIIVNWNKFVFDIVTLFNVKMDTFLIMVVLTF